MVEIRRKEVDRVVVRKLQGVGQVGEKVEKVERCFHWY